MKKIFALILALALVLSLAACGGNANTPGNTDPNSGNNSPVLNLPAQPDPNSWKYTVQDVQILMHAEAAPVLEALGEPLTYTEEASCAFTGLDKTYNYGGFFLETYPVNDVDYIKSVCLMDDSSSTPEGICIGSPVADVEAAYGAECFNGTNAYIMTGTTSTLTIIVESGVVSSIIYDAIIE